MMIPRQLRVVLASVASALLVSAVASADPALSFWPSSRRDVWHVCWTDSCAPTAADAAAVVHFELPATLPLLAPPLDAGTAQRRPIAIEYSHAYQVRLKIHKYASFATLPLFATELALGQSLYTNTPTDRGDARKGLHAFIGTSIIGLFGLNTVTGAWNLFGEGRKDPHNRTLKLVHGLLMMAADGGFVATTMSGPNSQRVGERFTYESDKAWHRDLAIGSISVATVGYLIMLFGNR
ncbi:MAG TPA: hypothetical protein VGL62_11220 [Vicinamibacterales bacterium]|jgi:hypothetical protein